MIIHSYIQPFHNFIKKREKLGEPYNFYFSDLMKNENLIIYVLKKTSYSIRSGTKY